MTYLSAPLVWRQTYFCRERSVEGAFVSLRKGFRVAVFLPKGHDYASRLIEGALGAAQDRALLQYIEIPYDEERAPPAAYSINVDGALVWTHPGCNWVLDLRDRGVKLVSFNTEWLSAGIPCVGMDLEASLDVAVKHLATLRRSNAAYVGHKTTISQGKQRQRDAFLSRARSFGWTAAAIEIPGNPSEERYRIADPESEKALITFLRELPKPAVLFCDDDYVAALVCCVAESIGLGVPADLAVLGYFDMMIARFTKPTISSLPGSGKLVGAMGASILADILSGLPPPTKPVFVAPPPVMERESTGGTTIRDDDMRKAHALIERFACAGLTVEQLLTRLSLSQKTLNKRFTAVYGVTPGEAIRSVRAQQAKTLLESTALSIGRIADMCGFEEQSNFNLFFKREVGCTPSEYRGRARGRSAGG